MNEYILKIKSITEEIDIKVLDIAFQAGKGSCGCATYKNENTELFIFGKFSDMVRVYSALRNNGYKVYK